MLNYHLITIKKYMLCLNQTIQSSFSLFSLFSIGLLLLGLPGCSDATKVTTSSPPTTTHIISFKPNGGVFKNSQITTLEVDQGETIDQVQLEEILFYPATGPQSGIVVTRDLFEWQVDGNKYELSSPVTRSITLEAVWVNSCGKVETVHPTDKNELQDYVNSATGDTPDLNHIDTSAITDMSQLFKDKVNFNGNIACWNTTKVVNMDSMFYNAKKFNQDLSEWAVDSVNEFDNIFVGTTMGNDRDKYPPKFLPSPPTVTISTNQALEVGASSTITFSFNKEVSGFTRSDIEFSFLDKDINMGNLNTISSKIYSLSVTPKISGALTIRVPVNSANIDRVLPITPNLGFSIDFSVLEDKTPPTVTINSETLVEGQSASLSFIFSEKVSNFTPDDIQFSSSVVKDVFITNSLQNYSLKITPQAVGNLKATILTNSFEDLSGNQSKVDYTADFTVNPSAANTHTVSFKLNGGIYTVPQITSLKVVDGETIDQDQLKQVLSYPPTGPQPNIEAVTREIFEWQNNKVKYEISTPVTSDLTLEAVWSNSCGSLETYHPTDTQLKTYIGEAITANPNTNLNHIDTSAIKTGMYGLFKEKEFNGALACWNTAKVTSMAFMFNNTTNFNQDIGNWNVSIIFAMNKMFESATSFNQDIGNWNVSKVTDMSYMFNSATAFNQSLGKWDVSSVNNMRYMFYEVKSFNQNIENWDVSSVNNMSFMFYGANDFNQPIGEWDVSSVNNMTSMFNKATDFNQPISNWNVSSVNDMNFMFYGANDFNQPIGEWDVSSVNNMSSMFNKANDFNQPIGKWNTGMVEDMNSMFFNATDFNQPISNWNVSSVTDMSFMFYGANDFNQPIGKWDVSIVNNMKSMFAGAIDFNQNIGSWNVNGVTDMSSMFNGASVFDQDLKRWIVNQGLTPDKWADIFKDSPMDSKPDQHPSFPPQ